MKHFLIVLGILIFCNSILGQNVEMQKTKYKHKVENYTRMMKTGRVFLIIGVPSAITGVALFVKGWNQTNSYFNQPYYTPNNDLFDRGVANQLSGYLLAAIGSAATISGAVFYSTGKRKSRQYKDLLEKIEFSAVCLPENQGISIRYKF